MVSLGMFCAWASVTAFRSRALESMSPLPPVRAATVISLISFVKILPRLASVAPVLCLIVCHFECPDMYRFPWVRLRSSKRHTSYRSCFCLLVYRISKYITPHFYVQNGQI